MDPRNGQRTRGFDVMLQIDHVYTWLENYCNGKIVLKITAMVVLHPSPLLLLKHFTNNEFNEIHKRNDNVRCG